MTANGYNPITTARTEGEMIVNSACYKIIFQGKTSGTVILSTGGGAAEIANGTSLVIDDARDLAGRTIDIGGALTTIEYLDELT